MHELYGVKFDASKMVEHFGGVAGAVVALKKIGIVMKHKTLQKQRERGNVPADVVAALLMASVKADKRIDPYEFLLDERKVQ